MKQTEEVQLDLQHFEILIFSSLLPNLPPGKMKEEMLVLEFSRFVIWCCPSEVQNCCLLHVIKQNCLLKNFLRTLILTTHISLPNFSSRTNLKLHNISVTPKMVKKVIKNLDSSKGPVPDFIPMVVLKNCALELS